MENQNQIDLIFKFYTKRLEELLEKGIYTEFVLVEAIFKTELLCFFEDVLLALNNNEEFDNSEIKKFVISKVMSLVQKYQYKFSLLNPNYKN